MPMPVSATTRTAWSPSMRVSSVRRPPFGIASMAFRTRLVTASRSAAALPSTVVEAQRLRAPELVCARELLQPPHHLRTVLGRLLDDRERPPQPLVLRAAQQELHAPDDDRQEIVEMVRGAARQLAERAQRLALHQLLLD